MSPLPMPCCVASVVVVVAYCSTLPSAVVSVLDVVAPPFSTCIVGPPIGLSVYGWEPMRTFRDVYTVGGGGEGLGGGGGEGLGGGLEATAQLIACAQVWPLDKVEVLLEQAYGQ